MNEKLYHAVRCTYSIEEIKELSLSLFSDSMGVNMGKRPSLYSDKHGGVKVKSNWIVIIASRISTRILKNTKILFFM